MTTNTSTQADSHLRIRPAPSPTRMENVEKIVTIGGRALVALLFVFAGAVKVLNPKPFLEHMTQFGVPTYLLPAVIALELGAGVAILIGWRIRDAAGALAIFCVMTAAIFHYQLSINSERTSFFKDLAIAGGLFVMAASASARKRTRLPVRSSIFVAELPGQEDRCQAPSGDRDNRD
jgi:putative oxidoreductase